jgi:hypothetical protein
MSNKIKNEGNTMNKYALILVATLMTAILAPTGSSAPPPNPLSCTNVDTSNPHFYGAASSADVSTPDGQTGGGFNYVYSTNGVPAGCDQLGSDGDYEQGLSSAQMPVTGASCPYSGGSSTVGHHGDDIYATNVAGIDITWSSGVDGQDPAATLAGQTCTGNGIVSDNPATDPADCSDSQGANINLLGSAHSDTDPLAAGTNDPASGFTCSDAVDGNVWTALTIGPFVGITFVGGGNGALIYIGGPTVEAPCVDTGYTGGNTEDLGCAVGVNLGWAPPTPAFNGIVGVSLPISGSIASGVEI